MKISLPRKKVSEILVFSVIIYSIVAGVFIYYTSEVFYDTVESISLPNGYISVDLDTVSPELNISFGVINTGVYDINDLELNLSFALEYYQNDELNTTYAEIFQKSKRYDRIQGFQNFEDVIFGDSTCFNLFEIINFHDNVNQSRGIKYLLNFEIDGLYCFKLLQFYVKIRNIPIYVL